jgi:hypothetical protein
MLRLQTAAMVLLVAVAAQAQQQEYWLFDDGSGTSAANEIGGGNTGTLVGTPAWITSGLEPKLTDRSILPSTAALDFTSPNHYVDGGNINLTSTSGGGEVTVSMWLRPDTLSGDLRLIGHLSGASTQAGAVGIGQTAGVGGVWVWTGAGFGHVTSAGALTAGAWQHLALVWDSGQVTAYLDGVPQLTATADFAFGAANGNFGLAAKYINTFGDGFDGQIDDVAIYSSALTLSEIEELANPPIGTDPAVRLDGSSTRDSIAANAPVGTLVGALSMINTNPVGFAYALNAGGDTNHFDIPAGTSNLVTKAALGPGPYALKIEATKDGFAVTNDFEITVVIPEFVLGPSSRLTPVIISEIMYHPKDREDGRSGEFVELFNTQLLDLDMGGWRLTGEISYTFPPGTLLRGRRSLTVAKDPSAHSGSFGILGPYTNALDNAGGTVRLKNNSGAILLEAKYSSAHPWPAAADGAGHSLILLRPDYGEDDIRAWAASSVMGGTPNLPDMHVSHGFEGLVINEFLAHTDPPLQDSIELFNANNTSMDLSGCWLSDSASVNKFRIPDGTIIGPRAFLVYSNELGFALSLKGGSIYLVSSNQATVIDGLQYAAQANAVSSGRYPDGMPDVQSLSARTLGSSNASPMMSDIVINEIMYHPISGYADDQYIELFNRGASVADVGYWRFTEGIDFMMPAGTVIPPGGYLVVARSLTNMLARYAQLNAVNTVGEFGGKLSFRGERLVLSRPDDPGLPFQDFVTVDEVTYSDGWGAWADGGGSSLELQDPNSDNRRGMNWAGSDETQKAPWTIIDYTDEVSNGSSEQGGTSPYTSPFEVVALMAGEYVVDDIVMTSGPTTHFSDNLEGGSSGWTFKGSHYRSAVEAGQGVGGSAGLRIRSSDRGEFSGDYPFFENHAQKNMVIAPQPGTVARIQAKVRWTCGNPFLLMGCRGYWCATPGDLDLPPNLGSPGLQNSRYATNAGPAIGDVTPDLVLPPAGSNVVVTCSVDDPDNVASVSLTYRVDPSAVTSTLPMLDTGSGGDRVAGDGLYTAIVPGQSAGTLVAFVIDATDGAASSATTRFPAKTVPPGAPPSECLMSWGLTKANGVGLPTYRVLITAANNSILTTLGYSSKQNVDCTFLYDDSRAIYAASVRGRGNSKPSGNVIRVPKGNRVLGANKLTAVNGSYYTESYLPWLCREVSEPSGYDAPIAYAFGTGGLAFHGDWLGPSTDLCETWFGDDDPEVFKNLDYSVDAFGMIENQFGMKKSRYAALSVKRAMVHPNDDYSQVFKIARAVNTADDAKFIKRTEAVIDIRSWASYFALAGLFGDWDKYGYAYSHNYYVYIPRHGRSQLMLHDADLAFATIGVQWPTGNQVPNRMFLNTPAFTRVYWSLLKDAADGPLLAERSDAYYDATRSTSVANGLDLGDPAAFKQKIATARASVLSGLATVDAPFEIGSNGGADFSTDTNPLTLTGTAPVHVETIRVNGHKYAVDYPTLTGWELRVWLQPGTNLLNVAGYDHGGTLVGSDSITVTYTGPEILVDGKLVINEIMYHPAERYASYVELHNLSTNTLSLGGLRIEGVDADIGYGQMIGPTGYVVIAGNKSGYQGAYTNAEVVVDTFKGTLDNGGETLRLLRPVGSNAWVEIDRVTYGDDPPWPALTDGGGASLQLIDATRDNNRVGNWAVDLSRPFTPGEANSVSAVLPEWPLVWINEVMPTNSPASSIADGAGDHDPWVELYNAGSNDVDLGASDFYLSDDYNNPTQWPFPAGAVITNGQRLLVWADDEPGEGALHTSFRLNGGTGSVVLAWVNGGQTSVVDAVDYGLLNGLSSYGSYPEGDPFSRQVFYVPTPGVANSAISGVPQVYINEWMADNKSTLADPADGGFDDWFELYNAGTTRVDLAGYRLNDRLHTTNSVVVPGGTSIEAGAFLFVWADGQSGWIGSDLHVDFQLSAGGEAVALFLPNGTLVDAVTFGAQEEDVGDGRWPDGAAAIYGMPISTPGTTNRLMNIASLGLTAFGTNLQTTVIWATRPGRRYRLEHADVLGPATIWSPCADDFTAKDMWFSTNILSDISVSNRFFRIRQL